MKASFPRQMHPPCLIPRGYSMCIWLKGMEERLTLGFRFSQRQRLHLWKLRTERKGVPLSGCLRASESTVAVPGNRHEALGL